MLVLPYILSQFTAHQTSTRFLLHMQVAQAPTPLPSGTPLEKW